uniref:Uncharacterized protein n=1 Tax=Romanomermis culicivorax TaxID=13658 RepID=A0A915HIC8_ROMCU
MNIGSFWWLREWCVLRVRHPGVDEPDGGVISLDQTRWIVQFASFIEEKCKMGSLDGVNDTKFIGPDARKPSKNESGDVVEDWQPRFAVIPAVVIAEILVNGY